MKGDFIIFENRSATYMMIGIDRWMALIGRYGPMICRNCHGPILPGDFCYTTQTRHNRHRKTYCGYCAVRIGLY